MVHERGGKRVPVADPVLLAEALLELLRDPAQRLAMGRYNRKLVETTMTWENVAQQLEEIYRQTIQKVAFTRHGHQRRNVLALDTPSVSEARDRV
jgi:glycosyltransferase involved in cell wall biosynthesis